jgi:hypothetical protein
LILKPFFLFLSRFDFDAVIGRFRDRCFFELNVVGVREHVAWNGDAILDGGPYSESEGVCVMIDGEIVVVQLEGSIGLRLFVLLFEGSFRYL